MIRVAVEVREGDTLLRATVSADSVRQAVSVMKERYPGRDVRVVFPISPEDFFLEGPKKAEPRPDDRQHRISLYSRARSMDQGAL
jgi:hypothetical protein